MKQWDIFETVLLPAHMKSGFEIKNQERYTIHVLEKICILVKDIYT